MITMTRIEKLYDRMMYWKEQYIAWQTEEGVKNSDYDFWSLKLQQYNTAYNNHKERYLRAVQNAVTIDI